MADPGDDATASRSIAAAYSTTGAAWQAGPGRVYDVLAEHLVAQVDARPGDVVLDIGAGTGAATRPLRRRGAVVVPLDLAHGMLAAGDATRQCAVVADACALPFGDGTFDAVVAAFSLNHVGEPVRALCEARRVLRPGGRLAASVYAFDDAHPVKDAVDAAAGELGWRPPDWIDWARRGSMQALATPDRAEDALRRAGLRGSAVAAAVPVEGLTPVEMVEWRLGMAQVAPFVATLDADRLAALRRRAMELLGERPEPLVRRIVELLAERAVAEPPLDPGRHRLGIDVER